MLRLGRFALLAGLAITIPAAFALDPPQKDQIKQDQKKQQTRDENKKKAEAPQKEAPSSSEHEGRLDRRNSRMQERNREIDGLLNKQK
jgi:hypothetical protein